MADLKRADELTVGDVMLDPNGDLTIEYVTVLDSGAVRVFVADDEFTAVWLFDPADLCRVVTRPGVPG